MRIDYIEATGEGHLVIPDERGSDPLKVNTRLSFEEVTQLYELLDIYLHGE